MSKILIISTSGRGNSNSSILCDQVAKGALTNGNSIEKIDASKLHISPCKGCGVCEINGGDCIQKDDFQFLVDKIQNSDVVIFATPIYFFNMSGLMKVILDRSTCYYHNPKFKKIGLITSSAAPIDQANELAIKGLEYFIHDMKNVEYVGCLKGNGVFKPGEVRQTELMDKAYRFGEKL